MSGWTKNQLNFCRIVQVKLGLGHAHLGVDNHKICAVDHDFFESWQLVLEDGAVYCSTGVICIEFHAISCNSLAICVSIGVETCTSS